MRLLFGAPNLIGGNLRVTLTNNRINCPRCGAWANILDGVYEIMGDAVRVIAAPEHSSSHLQALVDALRQAQQRNASPEEIKATIKEHAPELKTLADCLPKTRAELYAFVAVLVAMLAIVISQRNAVTPEQVHDIVDRAIEQAYKAQSAERRSSAIHTAEPIGPNRAERRTQRSKARHK